MTNEQAHQYGIDYASSRNLRGVTGAAAYPYILEGLKEYGIDRNGDDPAKDIFLFANFDLGFRETAGRN